MNKFQTAASRAEEKVREMMQPESLLRKPWQLVNYEPASVTLKCTASEIEELFCTEAAERPGYRIEEGRVVIPSLFVKLSGVFRYLSLPKSTSVGKTSKKGLVFNTIPDFMGGDGSSIKLDELSALIDENGSLNKEVMYNSPYYKYEFLRREYQDILFNNINYIIQNKRKIFLPSQTPDTKELLSSLLSMDYDILMLFQDFDFQYDVPYIIIHNEDRQSFSAGQVSVLTLLNLLGFDIVISSAKGYADIENHICRDIIDIHYSNIGRDKFSKRFFRRIIKPEQSRSGSRLKKDVAATLATLVILICIVVGIKLAANNLPINERPDAVQRAYVGIGTAVSFKDAELEKRIRVMIRKPEGPIYDILLLKITRIEIFGEIIGKCARAGIDDSNRENMWYEDINGNRYTERSKIRSLEDLKWFKNVEEINISYNSIEDISVLADMENLKYLNLSNNFITDISALGKLEKLQSIILDDNRISDITPLKDLKQVKQLGLESNKVSDIKALKDYPAIEFLNLRRNNISDISPLRNLKTLQYLYLSQNLVKDISPISELVDLKHLLIDGNPIEDYSVLDKLKIEPD